MTKEIFEPIYSRKSIRQFTGERVKYDDLVKIAEAAQATATSLNLQSRTFTIVQNKQVIVKLENALGSAIGQRNFDFYGTDALLLISGPEDYPYSQIETGLAVQNAYLVATALGLGTTWTDQIRNHCNDRGVRSILDEMNIPGNHICWTILPIGIPAEDPLAKERTEPITIIE